MSTASVADAAAFNPNGINTLLADGVNAFFTNDKRTLVHGPATQQRNPTDCIILESQDFDNFVFFDELLEKPCEDLERICQLIVNFVTN